MHFANWAKKRVRLVFRETLRAGCCPGQRCIPCETEERFREQSPFHFKKWKNWQRFPFAKNNDMEFWWFSCPGTSQVIEGSCTQDRKLAGRGAITPLYTSPYFHRKPSSLSLSPNSAEQNKFQTKKRSVHYSRTSLEGPLFKLYIVSCEYRS